MFFSRILVTCIGNICRSPMAQVLLQQQLHTGETEQKVLIKSAGLQGLVSHPADSLAVDLMKSMDLDISHHRSQKTSAELASWAELILVMTLHQQKKMELTYPGTRGKVFRLLENARGEGQDIPDPHQKGRDEFVRSLVLIRRGVDQWVKKLS